MKTKTTSRAPKAVSTSTNGVAVGQDSDARARRLQRKELGKFIVADPAICRGRPTFKGTRITVTNVLELLAEGMNWDEISAAYYGRIPREAIAEALLLAGRILTESGELAQDRHART